MKNSLILLMSLLSLGTLAQSFSDYTIKVQYIHNGETVQRAYQPAVNGSSFETEALLIETEYFTEEAADHLSVKVTALQGIELQSVKAVANTEAIPAQRFFANGIQSWSSSRELAMDAKIPRLRGVLKGILKWYGDEQLYNNPAEEGKLHSWTYTYFRRDDGLITLYGSTNEHTGYTLFIHDNAARELTIAKDCSGLLMEKGTTFNALEISVVQGPEQLVFDLYARDYQLNKGFHDSKATPMQGWTSWYHYFHKIDEDIILENLQAFKENNVPIDIFQIDDGYQKRVGEWTETNKKFPNGMAPIADSIHQAGYKAGLWLAPFIVERKSKIFKEHKDWFLKDCNGKPFRVGLNPGWSGKYYALDIYNQQVQQYLENTFNTVLRDWGFDLVKLDFLFAAGVCPPPDKTRGEVMADGMAMLREWVGDDKFILGCGVPIGPSIGKVDYMRIGSDIHMKWEHRLSRRANMRERLSTYNSLSNTIARRQLSGRLFLNDPDCFVLRDEKNKLTEAQKFTTFAVNNLFGELVLTSDNIAKYDSTTLALYLSGFPLQQKTIEEVTMPVKDVYRVQFSIKNRDYLALINLTGNDEVLPVSNGWYFENRPTEFILVNDERLPLPAYTTRLFYIIDDEKQMELLGGPGHLFSGQEVKQFMPQSKTKCYYALHPDNRVKAPLYLKVHTDATEVVVNGQTHQALPLQGNNAFKYVVIEP